MMICALCKIEIGYNEQSKILFHLDGKCQPDYNWDSSKSLVGCGQVLYPKGVLDTIPGGLLPIVYGNCGAIKWPA